MSLTSYRAAPPRNVLRNKLHNAWGIYRTPDKAQAQKNHFLKIVDGVQDMGHHSSYDTAIFSTRI
jgi:hypothetical protein